MSEVYLSDGYFAGAVDDEPSTISSDTDGGILCIGHGFGDDGREYFAYERENGTIFFCDALSGSIIEDQEGDD